MPPSCSYFQCKVKYGQKSMFRFPTANDIRLQTWIDNCGNMTITHLPRDTLRNKWICIDHFEKKFIRSRDGKHKRLNKFAVPFHYKGDQSTETFPVSPGASTSKGNDNLKKMQGDLIHHRYVCEDHFDKDDIHRYGGRAKLTGSAVPRPYTGGANNIQAENNEPDLEESRWQGNNADNVEAFRSLCMECKKMIIGFGFQWWCLQCGGNRCSECIMRMAHRPHFVLRMPANARPKQVEIVITAIQKELQLGSFFTREEDENSDQSETGEEDNDLNEGETAGYSEDEEPPVKAEPPDDEEDPLAECLDNHSLNTQPEESPTIDCSLSTEHRHSNLSNDVKLDKNSDLEDSFKTPTGIKSYSRTHRKHSHRPLGLVDSINRSSENLGLVNSSQYELNREYLGLDNTGYNPIIDYKPEQSLGPEDCQQIETTLGLEDSFEPQSQSFLGLDGFYDQPDLDDIPLDFRHSASIQSAPVGPMFSNKALNPDQNALELSGSVSDFGRPAVQFSSGLQSTVASAKRTTDLCPPSNKKIRLLNVEMDLDYNKTSQVTNIDHGYQQPQLVNLTEDALNSTEIKKLNHYLASQVNTKNKRKLTDTMKLKINDDNKSEPNKMQQSRILVNTTHSKPACENSAIRKEDRSKQKINNKVDAINDPHITQRLKNTVSFNREGNKSANNFEQQNDQNKTRQVLIQDHKNQSYTDASKRKDNKPKANSTEDPKSNPNEIQKPRILVYSTHKKLNCTDTSEHKNVTKIQPTNRTETTEIKTQFRVFSTHKARREKI